MNVISKPDKNFNFDTISLISPIIVAGGNHFIKILANQEPLYIQPPKCMSKDGVASSGKKMFSDLVFEHENTEFIQWMEDLNNYIQGNIFENRAKWFESDLDMHEIENFMISPLKLYKSGKLYLLRITVPTRLGVCTLKIFDESEGIVPVEDIKSSTPMITILEVRGVKCSPRSFQIEIEVKQMMVLSPNNIFEKCIIHSGLKSEPSPAEESDIPESMTEVEETMDVYKEVNEPPPTAVESSYEPLEKHLYPITSDELDVDTDTVSVIFPEEPEITEIDIDVVPESEVMQISTRNDVHYKMYKDAMRKAKNVRNLAISAYMNAKHIKNEYMLDDIKGEDESDLDDDSFNFDLDLEPNKTDDKNL